MHGEPVPRHGRAFSQATMLEMTAAQRPIHRSRWRARATPGHQRQGRAETCAHKGGCSRHTSQPAMHAMRDAFMLRVDSTSADSAGDSKIPVQTSVSRPPARACAPRALQASIPEPQPRPVSQRMCAPRATPPVLRRGAAVPVAVVTRHRRWHARPRLAACCVLTWHCSRPSCCGAGACSRATRSAGRQLCGACKQAELKQACLTRTHQAHLLPQSQDEPQSHLPPAHELLQQPLLHAQSASQLHAPGAHSHFSPQGMLAAERRGARPRRAAGGRAGTQHQPASPGRAALARWRRHRVTQS